MTRHLLRPLRQRRGAVVIGSVIVSAFNLSLHAKAQDLPPPPPPRPQSRQHKVNNRVCLSVSQSGRRSGVGTEKKCSVGLEGRAPTKRCRCEAKRRDAPQEKGAACGLDSRTEEDGRRGDHAKCCCLERAGGREREWRFWVLLRRHAVGRRRRRRDKHHSSAVGFAREKGFKQRRRRQRNSYFKQSRLPPFNLFDLR